MAKERLTLYDKYGNERDVDMSTEDVTLDNEGGKSLKNKLGEIDEAVGNRITSVTFNGNTPTKDSEGNVNLGQQAQADWGQMLSTYPSYIRNKPTIPTRTSELTNDAGFITAAQIPEGSTPDAAMSSTSENAVQNKVIKAYVDAVSQRIDTLIGSGNVQGAIDTFNEVVAFLNGINSSDTLAAKLALKANSADVYTKNEVNGLLQDVDVDLSDYYDKDEVDELIENIPAGPQGPKGDTVVVDTEGLEQFGLANSLDSSSTTDGLTARQGKILKQAIMTVAANLQALYNALAGVAFTELPKPAQTPIDWTGGTFYVAITKSLTGVTDTNDAVQVAENGSYTNTLSPQSGLTMKSVVVTMGGVDITSTAYTAATGVISIAQVTGDIVITALAELVVTYNVTKKFINMTDNNSDTEVVSGDGYSTQISANSGCTDNGILRVRIGSEWAFDETSNSNTSGITYVNGLLTIPAAAITDDVLIVASAFSGTITIGAADAAGTTVTIKDASNNTVVNAESIAAGETGTFTVSSFKSISFGTAAGVKSIDLGGAVYALNSNRRFNGNINGYTALASITNAVLVLTDDAPFSIFQGCTALTTMGATIFLDGSTQMNDMFNGDSLLESLDTSTWVNVNKITTMSSAFRGCSKIKSLDLSGITIDADEVTINTGAMSDLFRSCPIETLIIGYLDTSGLSATNNPFNYSSSLTKLICKSTDVPPVNNTNSDGGWLSKLPVNALIYVQDSAVNDYKSAAGWSIYESRIKSINELS